MKTYCVTLVTKQYHRIYVEAVDETDAIAKAEAEGVYSMEPDDTDADWYVDTVVKEPKDAAPTEKA
jgi:hypothetical protein